MRIIAYAAVLCLALVLPACGKGESKKVYSTSEGKVEVTRKDKAGKVQELTVKSKEGTATMTMGATIPDDLGVPLYPGVEADKSASWKMQGNDAEKGGAYASTMLFSKDPLDRVAAFYKEKLGDRSPQVYEMNMPNGRMITLLIEEEGVTTSLALAEDKKEGGTRIHITRAVE